MSIGAHWALTTTGPAIEPITTTQALTHLREDSTGVDDYVDELIQAARESAEVMMNRATVNATYVLKMDRFPSIIELPRGQCSSITSIDYYDSNGDTQSLDSTDYQADTDSTPARLKPNPNDAWPNTELGRLNAVTVTYTAGYGSTRTDVPQCIKNAMYLLIGHWYEHREAVITGTITKEIEMSVKALLATERIPGIY